jgi:hypothetical protein
MDGRQSCYQWPEFVFNGAERIIHTNWLEWHMQHLIRFKSFLAYYSKGDDPKVLIDRPTWERKPNFLLQPNLLVSMFSILTRPSSGRVCSPESGRGRA